MEGNKKEANKKEHCLSASRVFDSAHIVSGENFKRTKPDPEIYEYTCKQIGVSKDEIWVVEDSEYGIEAAKKAGLKVMGLYNSKLYQDLTDANLIISSLKQIMEEDIW